MMNQRDGQLDLVALCNRLSAPAIHFQDMQVVARPLRDYLACGTTGKAETSPLPQDRITKIKAEIRKLSD